MDKSSLGDRMKGYEKVPSTKLLRRMPVIIRLDGKAFHTWTKHLSQLDDSLERSPFSEVMHECMATTTEYLVSNIQNAVLGYTQSDEITILLNDWKTLTTDQWFGGGIQKIASVSASMATAHFGRAYDNIAEGLELFDGKSNARNNDFALFDSRVFNVPKEDVANCFLWRQQDATRNSVQMLGRFYFSHKEMHQKNVSQVQDMLMLEKDVNWNDLATWMKRGTCVVRTPDGIAVDEEIPIFTQNREYINSLLREDEKIPSVEDRMEALERITKE